MSSTPEKDESGICIKLTAEGVSKIKKTTLWKLSFKGAGFRGQRGNIENEKDPVP